MKSAYTLFVLKVRAYTVPDEMERAFMLLVISCPVETVRYSACAISYSDKTVEQLLAALNTRACKYGEDSEWLVCLYYRFLICLLFLC
jgi:hypothetical protein